MDKLKKKFQKFKKEYYKWEKYLAAPKTVGYSKKTEVFDRDIADFYIRNYQKLQKKMRKLNELKPLKIDRNDVRPALAKKISRIQKKNKVPKVLLTDVGSWIKFKDTTNYVWRTFSFQFNLKTVSYESEVLEDFIRQKIIRWVYENYSVVDVGEMIFKYFNLKKVALSDIKLGRVSLQYKFLNDLNGVVLEKEYKDFCCVIRHILDSCKGKPKLKRLNEEKLKQQLTDLKINYKNGISVNEQIRWIKTYYPNTISLYALDPYYSVFDKNTAKDARVTLVYLCNNKHIYVINDQIQKKYIANAKHLGKEVDCSFKVNATEYEYINQYSNQDPEDLCDEYIDSNNGNMKYVYNASVTKAKEMTTKQREEEKQKYNDMLEGKKKGQVFCVDDPYGCALEVTEKCSPYTISNMKSTGAELTSFVHPISGCVIENGVDYEKRLEFCNKLYQEINNCYNFTFKNQSFAQMAGAYQEIKFGKLYQKSSYSQEHMKLLDDFYTTPLMRTLVKNHDPNENCKGIDIRMSYTNAVLKMKENYPVFCTADDPVLYQGGKIVCGEYLVEHFKIPQLGGMIFQKQWLSHNIVKRLMKKGYLPKNKIILEAKASFHWDPSILTEFMKGVLEMFPRSKYGKYTKAMCNAFIGMLGKRYFKTDKAFLTTDYDTVQAMYCMYPEGFNMNKLDDLYFVRNTIETRMDKDHGPIFRQILCEGMWSVIELLEQVYGKGSKLISYKTDAVFVENPVKEIQELDQEKYKAEKWKPYIYSKFEPREGDDSVTELKDWTPLKDIQFKGANILLGGKIRNREGRRYLKKLRNMSFCCCGKAGCQKTTLLKEMYVEGETLVLCYTNSACQNIIEALGKDSKVYTFDSKFWNQEDCKTIFQKTKRILVDEFSMIPLKWFEKLYRLKRDNNIEIQFYGDPNQCAPVEEKFKRHIDYMGKKVFRWMCDDNLMTKEFIPMCGRYNEELNDVLNYFLKYKTLPKSMKDKTLKKELPTNVSLYNPTRHQINARFHKKYSVGEKVIAKKNNKPKQFYNSRFYYIKSIQNNKVTLSHTENGPAISGVRGPFTFNLGDVDPVYCITCYRYQGKTIEEDYNIYDTHKMNFNQMYTSLSRGRRLDQINFNYTEKVFNTLKEPDESTELTPIIMTKGEIYECHNEEKNLYYIGITDRNTKKRFEEHCQYEDDPIFKSGGKKEWKAKKLINMYYYKKKEIEKVEGYYLKEYFDKGCQLVNTQKVPKSPFKVTKYVN